MIGFWDTYEWMLQRCSMNLVSHVFLMPAMHPARLHVQFILYQPWRLDVGQLVIIIDPWVSGRQGFNLASCHASPFNQAYQLLGLPMRSVQDLLIKHM